MAKGIQPPQNGLGSRSSRRPQSLDLHENQGNSRRAGLPLPLNTLAIPVPFFSTPDREEVEQDGETLFQYFVQEQLTNAGFGESIYPGLIPLDGGGDVARAAPVSTPDGYKNSTLAHYGRELRDLAEQFARSKENVEVRNRADNVNLSDITRDGFLDLLQELFHDGFRSERLIALFYFCLYLIIRAITGKREKLFREIFMWSLQFIRHRVCKWVYEHGGWGKVLGNIYDVIFKVASVATLCFAMYAMYVFIKKNAR